MKLSAEIRNQKELTDLLGKLAGGELRKAYALALNDTGFMVRGKQVAALNGAFDRVTPFVGRSPKVFKATAEQLSGSIAPTLHTDRSATDSAKRIISIWLDMMQTLQNLWSVQLKPARQPPMQTIRFKVQTTHGRLWFISPNTQVTPSVPSRIPCPRWGFVKNMLVKMLHAACSCFLVRSARL